MQEEYIAIASTVFFFLIALEFFVARHRKCHEYRINDGINSLSLGVMSQISGVFLKFLSVGVYAWVFSHAAIFDLSEDSLLVWVSCLLLYDFFYYWLHRMGHQTNLLWAAHVVHHQSEEYNLTTALRQTSSGAVFGWVFYLPLAVIGYPVKVFIVVALIDLIYQFWIHTQQIDKLGWFDRVFVSPSNHRVHHGVNDIYLDKNYGGILIIWDRLFDTYIEECEAPVYGTRSPLLSWNPVQANLQVYLSVFSDAWHTQNWRDKLAIWFMPPGWRPHDLPAYDPNFDLLRTAYNPPLHGAKMWYCLTQFTLVLLITTHFLLNYQRMGWLSESTYAIWLVGGFWIIGGLMEARVLYLKLEYLRLFATMVMVSVSSSWFSTATLALPIRIAIVITCLISLKALHFLFQLKFTDCINA
jgi:sterol desaturase/sphingolipid hydroxylase (fatty acid hydroxylase superfamily)